MSQLISIIIPVYKVEKYLDRCVQSVVKQDYENIEILLVDDGSPDGCPALCDAWAEKDSRIRVIHQQNGGLSAARNTGIEAAKGSWLMFVDSDDWVEPDFCSLPLLYAEKENCDLVVFGIDKVHEDRSTELCPTGFRNQIMSKEEVMLALASLRMGNYVVNKLYKKELFRSIRFPVGRNWEDLATTYLLLERAEQIYHITAPLYHYFIHNESITQVRLSIKQYSDIFQAREAQHSFFAKQYPAAAEVMLDDRITTALQVCIYATMDKTGKYEKIMNQAKEVLRQTRYVPTQMDKKHKLALWSARNMPFLFDMMCFIMMYHKGE